MTDRHAAYIVVLEHDIREDSEQAKGILAALGAMRGVISVDPLISNAEVWTAESRARHQLENKIWQVLREPLSYE